MNIIDALVISFLLITFPIGVRVFAGKRVTFRGLYNMLSRYDVHFFLIILIFALKSVLLYFEGPVEGYFSIDFTRMFHDVEGNHVFWIQHNLYHPWLTAALVTVYIGSFLFIYLFSFALFAYIDRIKIASNIITLHLVLFLLTIPFYLFFVVYVPSYPKMLYPGAESFVKGIEPLLYNYSQGVNDFFIGYDTFNNCFPSMHTGYPCAILLLLVRKTRNFLAYKLLLLSLLLLIMLAILYLGIHWIIDILGGIGIAILGVALTEKYNDRFWRPLWRYKRRYDRWFDGLKDRYMNRSS